MCYFLTPRGKILFNKPFPVSEKCCYTLGVTGQHSFLNNGNYPYFSKRLTWKIILYSFVGAGFPRLVLVITTANESLSGGEQNVTGTLTGSLSGWVSWTLCHGFSKHLPKLQTTHQCRSTNWFCFCKWFDVLIISFTICSLSLSLHLSCFLPHLHQLLHHVLILLLHR